jgi:hypothetical protein
MFLVLFHVGSGLLDIWSTYGLSLAANIPVNLSDPMHQHNRFIVPNIAPTAMTYDISSRTPACGTSENAIRTSLVF